MLQDTERIAGLRLLSTTAKKKKARRPIEQDLRVMEQDIERIRREREKELV